VVAKKVVAKKSEVVKSTPKAPAPAASNVVAIPAPSKGSAAKAIVLSRGNGPVRSRSRRSSERATPKLEPRVKKDTSKNEAMFERTQSAPTISAPKITEFLSAPSYTSPEPVKPKPNVRYSDKDLKVFKALIESEKEKTLDELRMLKERLEDLTNYEASEETAVYSMHMAEQGSEAVEREKTYAQIQRTTDYLRKLDEAMGRIEEKTYGICRQCGILIARERLMAVPITTLSASWKLRQQCPTDGIDRVGR
ncbi:MAG: TraR/DksA family transcriptional regulator, partial [Candidatus Kapaibacterium sp.]